MPFTALTDFDTIKKYETVLKTELNKLDGEPSEFFFCEKFPLEGKKVDLLFVGKIKKPVIEALKTQGASLTWGQVTANKKSLKLEVERGKLTDSKLTPVLKGTTFTFELVDSIATPSKPSEEDQALLQKSVKAKRALFTVSETFKDMGHVLAPSDRSAIRKDLESAETLIEQGKPDQAQVLIDKSIKELEEQKAAIKNEVQSRKQQLGQDLEKELQDIARQLGPLNEQISVEERKVKVLQNTIDSMLQAQKKPGIKQKEFLERKGRIEIAQGELTSAQQKLKEVRDKLDPQIALLEELKDKAPVKMQTIVQNMQQRLTAVENASKSAEQMHKELSDLVGKMSQATAWQKDNKDTLNDDGTQRTTPDDDVNTTRGHGTGRHGAQTGLDRQAQRASTEEGVTPDQPGNKFGVTQHQTSWNKVSIVYETDTKGQKVIKNRTTVVKNIVNAVSNTVKSDVGSMWATPVLEREAVKRAIDTAKAMEPYLEYEKNGAWHAFTSLAITLGKPTSAPGWGYAVESDGTHVDPAEASRILGEFEKGKLTLDGLFNELNVKLVTRDGGAEMIHHAIVVFKRATGGAKWELVTHYPNHKLTSADVGWECARDWRPGTVKFKTPTGTTTVSNKKLV